MLKRIFVILLLSTSWLFAQDIPAKPNPPRLVNDFVGGLLSQGQIDALESKLKTYNDTTSTQITIVIVKSVQPYDISEYAIKLGREWGVGQKGKNNGIVLLWAPGDRKVFIATGYGMEGSMTDAYSKRIIEQVIKPNFKALQYYAGLDQAVDGIINYSKGEHQADTPEASAGDFVFVLIMFLIIVAVVIYIMRKGGGGSGGGGGRGWTHTTYTGWGTSSGSWGGGFGGGGSSDSGGGFGGFGGGSFGGGGAGGDY